MMGGLAVPESGEIVNPMTGALVPAADVAAVGTVLADLRAHRDDVDAAIRAFTDAAVAESERQGTRTLRAEGVEIKITPDTEIEWDVTVLAELPGLGLPAERYAELVTETVEYRVSGTVARQLETASQVYADVIRRARGRKQKRQYANVRTR